MNLEDYIRTIPNFPIEGILFKDITPLLLNGEAFAQAAEQMAAPFKDDPPDVIAAAEARGFLFAVAVARELGGCGVALVRKAGKLPAAAIGESYDLEYGTATLEIHADAVQPGQKVLLCDDLLATGGTVAATERLIARLAGQITGATFLVELDFLSGRSNLADYPIHSLIHYGDGE